MEGASLELKRLPVVAKHTRVLVHRRHPEVGRRAPTRQLVLGAVERRRTRAYRAMAWRFTGAAAGLHRLDDGVVGRKLLKREKESADAAVLKGRLDRQRRSALDERLEDD